MAQPRRVGDSVQALRDPAEPIAGSDLAEHSLNQISLNRVNHSLDVISHPAVVVPVAESPGDVPPLGLPAHRVPRPLHRLLPVHPVHVGHGGEHELVGFGGSLDLAIGQVAEHPDPGIHDPAEAVGDLPRGAAEPALIHQNQHLERRPVGEGGHQRHVAGPLLKLRAADSVVHVHVGVSHRPALRSRVRAGPVHLPRDRFLLVGHVLIGALAGVDGCDHALGLPCAVSPLSQRPVLLYSLMPRS